MRGELLTLPLVSFLTIIWGIELIVFIVSCLTPLRSGELCYVHRYGSLQHLLHLL